MLQIKRAKIVVDIAEEEQDVVSDEDVDEGPGF